MTKQNIKTSFSSLILFPQRMITNLECNATFPYSKILVSEKEHTKGI
jgi:hypothetical protein